MIEGSNLDSVLWLLFSKCSDKVATFLRIQIPCVFPEISSAFLNFSPRNSREENLMECIFVGDHVT